MFGGLRADRLVSEQLMQSLARLGMEAAIEAIESLESAAMSESSKRHWH